MKGNDLATLAGVTHATWPDVASAQLQAPCSMRSLPLSPDPSAVTS